MKYLERGRWCCLETADPAESGAACGWGLWYQTSQDVKRLPPPMRSICPKLVCSVLSIFLYMSV